MTLACAFYLRKTSVPRRGTCYQWPGECPWLDVRRRRLMARCLESERIADFHEHRIASPREAAEPERVFIQHVAAVPGEHDGAGDGLIADQGVDVEEIRGGGRRTRHAARPRDQDRCVGPRVVALRIGLVLDVLADEPDEEGPRQLV